MKFCSSHYYYYLVVLLTCVVVAPPFFSSVFVAVVDARPQNQEDRRSCPAFPKGNGGGGGGGCKKKDESLVCLRKDAVAASNKLSKKSSKKSSSSTTTTTTAAAYKEYEQACVKDSLLAGVFIGYVLVDDKILADCGCCTDSLRTDVRNDLLLNKDNKLLKSDSKGLISKCLARSDMPTCFSGNAAYVTQQCQTQLKGDRQCCTGGGDGGACSFWLYDYATVCEGACRSTDACIGFGGPTTVIGARSCQGSSACSYIGDFDPATVVQVGRDSCVGDNAPCAGVGAFAQSVRIGNEACRRGGKRNTGSIDEVGGPCSLVGSSDADAVSIADGACAFSKSESSTCNSVDGPGSLVCIGKTCSSL